MNKEDRNFGEFNKEVLYGEAGAILGAAAISTLASHFTMSRIIISQFAVIGSMLGGGSLFLIKKIQHKIQKKQPVLKSTVRDLEVFTPAALLITLVVSYPIVYYLTKFFIKLHWHPYFAGGLSEIGGFLAFLLLINIYRLILVRKFKRDMA